MGGYRATVERSDLPFGSEFSPSQIDLAHALELAKEHSGNAKALEKAILETYFSKNKTGDYNKNKHSTGLLLTMLQKKLG